MISRIPFSDKFFASSIIFSKDLEYSGPLVNGTTQILQNLSHPSGIVKNEDIACDEFLILSKKLNLAIVSNSVSSNFFFC